jgi:hypothetical protein
MEKVAVESPDRRKAAEMTNATMILRMFYPLSRRSSRLIFVPLYSPPSAQALPVSWPVVKLVAEMPDTMKAAESMKAMITLRIFLSPCKVF